VYLSDLIFLDVEQSAKIDGIIEPLWLHIFLRPFFFLLSTVADHMSDGGIVSVEGDFSAECEDDVLEGVTGYFTAQVEFEVLEQEVL
jgi:hypothetical protein